MRALIKHPQDFCVGLMYTAIGIGAAWIAQGYRMGSIVRMGPGYFPTMLSILLIAVGVVCIVRSFLHKGERIGTLPWREIVLIISSIVLFGLLVRHAGLVIALIVLVLVSAYASPKFQFKTALVLAAISALASAIVFVKALRLPFPILGTWFG